MDALISGETNVPVEIELRAQVRREASADLDVEVAVSGPDGTRWRIPAFRAGERTFRARFAAPMPGQYSWRCVCSGADADLAAGIVAAGDWASAKGAVKASAKPVSA